MTSPQQEIAPPSLPGEDLMKPAPIGGRFVAALVDTVIYATPPLILVYSIEASNPGFVESWEGQVPTLVTGILYEAVFTSSAMMGTPGKRLMGYRVTSLDGRRLSFLAAAARHLAKIPSTLLLMIGYFMALFDPARRTLHDRLAGTLVVQKDVNTGVVRNF